jgi:hypothetical protein
LSDRFPYATVPLGFDGRIFVSRPSRFERDCRNGTGFRDYFTALATSFLMATELLVFLGREFSYRRQRCEFFKSFVL